MGTGLHKDVVTLIDTLKPLFFPPGWVVMVCSAKRELYEVQLLQP